MGEIWTGMRALVAKFAIFKEATSGPEIKNKITAVELVKFTYSL
jgi:hypothetical protein